MNKSGSLSHDVLPGSSVDILRLWVILSKLNLFAKFAEAEQLFSSRWFSSRKLCFVVMQESNLDDRKKLQ